MTFYCLFLQFPPPPPPVAGWKASSDNGGKWWSDWSTKAVNLPASTSALWSAKGVRKSPSQQIVFFSFVWNSYSFAWESIAPLCEDGQKWPRTTAWARKPPGHPPLTRAVAEPAPGPAAWPRAPSRGSCGKTRRQLPESVPSPCRVCPQFPRVRGPPAAGAGGGRSPTSDLEKWPAGKWRWAPWATPQIRESEPGKSKGKANTEVWSHFDSKRMKRFNRKKMH